MTTTKISQNQPATKIDSTVWKIGWMMCLVNLSFVMGYSYIAIYMDSLGVAMAWIGVAEGVAEASSYLMKLFSGMISDFLRRRKPIMVIGYSMIVTSRVLFGLANSFMPLFFGRLVERIGNGTQSTPRDTMVADVVPAKHIGAAYGLKRTLSQAGAFLGAIVGMVIIRWFDNDIQSVFQVAIFPAIIAYCILIFLIKEPKRFTHSAVSSEIPLPEEKRRHPISLKNLPLLGKSFWTLMLVAAIFMLARFGESFLALYAWKKFDLPLENVPLVMMVYNAAWCLTVYPVGKMSDRMNRYWFLIIGILFLVLADMVMANAESLTMMWFGIAFWGIQMGITQNIFLSLIAEIVPEDLRGTGFGCYYIICAFSEYFANHIIAGVISQHFGQSRMFLASGMIAAFSLLVLIVIMGYKSKKQH
ncbi:MAG: MFS transporter [Proteobacteria bacterium]|nr:MFS transporter [Pseudomonadota bacterium]